MNEEVLSFLLDNGSSLEFSILLNVYFKCCATTLHTVYLTALLTQNVINKYIIIIIIDQATQQNIN